LSLHGIKDNSSVFVEADPVVGEDGIGLVGLKSIFKDCDFNTLFLKDGDVVVELLAGLLLSAFQVGAEVIHEGVVLSSFFIVAESDGSDHHEGIGGL